MPSEEARIYHKHIVAYRVRGRWFVGETVGADPNIVVNIIQQSDTFASVAAYVRDRGFAAVLVRDKAGRRHLVEVDRGQTSYGGVVDDLEKANG